MTGDDCKRLAQSVEKLERAQAADLERLEAMMAKLNHMQETVDKHTLLLVRTRDEVIKISRGLGVY